MDTHASARNTREDIIRKVAEVLHEERATVTNIESAIDKAGVDCDDVNVLFGSMHGLILEMFPTYRENLYSPWKIAQPTEQCERCSLSSEIGSPIPILAHT